MSGDKGSYVTVKLDFEDNRSCDNLKILLNKNVFINGKMCHTLPWVNKSSTPQCGTCQRWGHSTCSCMWNISFCAICSVSHETSDHDNSLKRGENHKYTLACINCLAAGLTHTHHAMDRLCPFFVKWNNKVNITNLLEMIRNRQLEGYENPFGCTKVRSSQNSYDLSSTAQ